MEGQLLVGLPSVFFLPSVLLSIFWVSPRKCVITIQRELPLISLLIYQQSSTDIWHAICAAVKAACSLANIAGEEVIGLGFAATCSLGL